jgi:hypothetical protein
MMLNTEQLQYRAFGLSIKSEFSLPELPLASRMDGDVDVEVKEANLTPQWSELGVHPFSIIVKKNFVMFQLPGVAIFLIKNGREIFVSPQTEEDLAQIRLFILGTCMGAILLQRGILPLHGSAVAIHGKAYAFIGDSGAGKSTLASTLLTKGFELISDDILPITFSEDNGIPYVAPTYPQQKLWIESLNHLGIKAHGFSSIINREDKYLIPLSKQFSEKALPLGGIYELVKTERENIELTKLSGLATLERLSVHTYRNLFIKQLGLDEWHFLSTVKLVENVKTFQLKRPEVGFTAHGLMETILTSIQKEQSIC